MQDKNETEVVVRKKRKYVFVNEGRKNTSSQIDSDCHPTSQDSPQKHVYITKPLSASRGRHPHKARSNPHARREASVSQKTPQQRHNVSTRKNKETSNKYKIAYKKLKKEFPELLSLHRPKPLALGIRGELLAANTKVSNKTIRLGLFFYCNSFQYLKCLTPDKPRYNIKMEEVGKVTEEEALDAKQKRKAVLGK